MTSKDPCKVAMPNYAIVVFWSDAMTPGSPTSPI